MFGMAWRTGGWRTGSSPLPPSSWRSGRRAARGGGGRNQLTPGSQLTPGWTARSCRSSPRSSGRSRTLAGSCWQKWKFIRSVSWDFVEFNPIKGHWNLNPLTPHKGLCWPEGGGGDYGEILAGKHNRHWALMLPCTGLKWPVEIESNTQWGLGWTQKSKCFTALYLRQ